MLISLPLIAAILIFVSLSCWKNTARLLLKERLAMSLVLWTLVLMSITELLSPFHLINTQSLTISWTIVSLVLGALILKTSSIQKPGISFSLPRMDLESKIMICVIGIILAVTFVLAAFTAPSNIDAMANQLGRLPHWIQNQSIEFYPTNLSWQINNGIVNSSIQLHLYLLSGGDWLANLVQWIFFIGSLLAVTLIAKYFGANSKGQVTSAFIFATIPMAILQAETVQDPLLISFFLLSFIYFSLKFLEFKNKTMLFFSGASLGLSFLTKQTSYFYAFPFFVWFFYLFAKNFGLKRAFSYFLIISLAAIAINFPFYLRNFQFSNRPLFVIRNDYINSPIGINSAAATVIKNLGMNISTPVPSLNQAIYHALSSAMTFLKLPENGPNFNWVDIKFHVSAFIPSDFNTAPSPIHLILIFVVSIFLFRNKVRGLMREYFICIGLGFALFSAIFKWQEAGSHILFALFALAAAVIGIIFTKWNKLMRYLLIASLALSSFYFLFFNIHKPITPYFPSFVLDQKEKLDYLYSPIGSHKSIFALSREEQYFETRKQLYRPYEEIGQFVKKGGYQNIGVIFTEYYSDHEYPLWVILKRVNKKIRIEHVDVTNATARLSTGFKPDVVIFLGTDKSAIKKYIDKGVPVIGL